jgi:hypothetical protein
MSLETGGINLGSWNKLLSAYVLVGAFYLPRRLG